MTISPDACNPFVPGSGIMPDTFPGREKEQGIFQEQIQRLRTKARIPGDIIISAPRGNGKTALLDWLKKEIQDNHKKETDIKQITPNKIRDIGSLTKLLKAETIIDKIQKIAPLKTSVNIGIPETPININAAAEWEIVIGQATGKVLRFLNLAVAPEVSNNVHANKSGYPRSRLFHQFMTRAMVDELVVSKIRNLVKMTPFYAGSRRICRRLTEINLKTQPMSTATRQMLRERYQNNVDLLAEQTGLPLQEYWTDFQASR